MRTKILTGLTAGWCMLGMLTAAMLAANVYATPITFNIDVQVYQIDDPDNIIGGVLGLTMHEGDVFNAAYTMDSDAGYSYVGPGYPEIGTAQYTVDTVSTHASINGTSLVAANALPYANMFIGNNFDPSGQGQQEVDAWRVLAGLPGTQPAVSMGMILFDGTATRLSDTDFFINASYDGWDNAVFYFLSENRLIMLASSNIEADPVPLPATLVLLGSGVFFLAGIRSRRKRA